MLCCRKYAVNIKLILLKGSLGVQCAILQCKCNMFSLEMLALEKVTKYPRPVNAGSPYKF